MPAEPQVGPYRPADAVEAQAEKRTGLLVL